MISHQMQYPPPPPQAMAQYPGTYAPQVRYGGFWIRLVARLIDGLLLGIPFSILFGIVAALGGVAVGGTSNADANTQNAAAAGVTGIIVVLALIAGILGIGYYIYFWGRSGQTLGMRLFKLRIVDANTGGPIGYGRAFIRLLMTVVNSWACYIGWIWVAFDPRKQGWHDKVANSVVLQG